MAPPQVSLSLSVTGIGEGQVASDIGGLQCSKAGGTCQAMLDEGSSVTLTATAAPGFFFNGWRGDCRGVAPCTLTLDQAASVHASFVNILFYSNQDLDATQDRANDQSSFNIWTVNSDGSQAKALAGLVASRASSTFPSFSPDGNQIAFLSTRALNGSSASTANFGSNLWVMNADGSNPQPLAGLDVDGVSVDDFAPPQWSPDGRQIAFTSNRRLDGGAAPDDNNGSNIWVVNVDGTELRPLAGIDVASVDSESPVWSPDGSQIAFDSNRNLDLSLTISPNHVFNIWVMNADGSDLHPLTFLTVQGTDSFIPQWSSQDQIAFSSLRNRMDPDGLPEASSNLWTMEADGSNPQPLTDFGPEDVFYAFDHQWSPDGRILVFSSDQDPAGTAAISALNIWAVPADGSQAPFPLTQRVDDNFILRAQSPYWAPDASAVILDSNYALDSSAAEPSIDGQNIWIVQPDGKDLHPLTHLTDALAFSPVHDFD